MAWWRIFEQPSSTWPASCWGTMPFAVLRHRCRISTPFLRPTPNVSGASLPKHQTGGSGSRHMNRRRSRVSISSRDAIGGRCPSSPRALPRPETRCSSKARHGSRHTASTCRPSSRCQARAAKLPTPYGSTSIVDDQFLNCLEVVGASQTKAILLLQTGDPDLEQQATERGVGVVHRLEEVIEVLLQLQDILPEKRGVVMRLAEWFRKKEPESHVLPMNPRVSRPLPPVAD